MRQNHALDRKSRRDRDFQIVARTISAASMSRDGTYDGKAESGLQCIDRHDEHWAASLLFMTDRRVGIHFQDVSLR
jgi:hypothetical protein